MIVDHLSKVGYVVTVKADLAEALNWLYRSSNRPDLIISDVAMSGLDGHAFIRQVRPDPAAICPLIILLAAEDDIGDKIAGFEAGADDYLVEPVNAVELGLRIRALLARAQARRRVYPDLSRDKVGVPC
jgi:DNA-binding response OmpR family regulator